MTPLRFFTFFMLFSAPVRCEEAPAEQPLPAPEDSRPELEDLVNITFKNDARVFAVMAALNAAGFDYERSGRTLSAERQAVRKHLEGIDADLVLRLQTYYKSHRRYRDEGRESADYISLALLLSDVPDLAFPEETGHTAGGHRSPARLCRSGAGTSTQRLESPICGPATSSATNSKSNVTVRCSRN